MKIFQLHAPFEPTGDQPEAIRRLVEGVRKGYRHQVLLGATGTGKSVVGDTPVWLLVGEREGSGLAPMVVPVGPYVDHLFERFAALVVHEGEHEVLPTATLPYRFATLAFSLSQRKIGVFPVGAFTRHRNRERLYRVTTRCGRTVAVTGGHNFWALRQGRWVLTTPDTLEPQDALPIPAHLPPPTQPLTHVNLLEYLQGANLFVEAPETIAHFLEHHNPGELVRLLEAEGLSDGWSRVRAMRTGRRGRGLRVSVWWNLLHKSVDLAAAWLPAQATVGGKSRKHRLPVQYPLSSELARLMGYYLAEGHAASRYLLLSVRSPVLVRDLQSILHHLGIAYTRRSSGDFQISSATLSTLFRRWMGARAEDKHLPPFWPELAQEHLSALLSAYFDGDGTVERASAVTAVSASPHLMTDIQTALLRFGIWARTRKVSKRATNSSHAGGTYTLLTISGQENLRRFAQIGFRHPAKQEALHRLLQRTGNSNVDLVPLEGATLQHLREQWGLTRSQAARLTGVLKSTLRSWERGWRHPQRLALRRYLDRLSAHISAIREAPLWQELFFLTEFFWSPVEDIEVLPPGEEWVYDLSVPEAETFLGGTGGLFLHNTFTIASVIAQLQLPALVLAHNKTLAAQLYAEFKSFFPENAVEYFVSYYDYYQPEAYIPQQDLYIEKDTEINEEIDRLRLAATTALMSRKDVIIVASVSAIYGLGSPEAYGRAVIHLEVGQIYRRNALLRQLVESQYQRNDLELRPGTFRVRGDTLEVAPAYEDEKIYRISFFGDEVERILEINPLTGETLGALLSVTIFPAKHYLTEEEKLQKALADIERELEERVAWFKAQGKLLEAQRLEQRTRYDLEMLREVGYCSGIENYSRHLEQRPPGSPPWTLMDYLPAEYLLIIDESHMTIPQIRGMYHGDRSRKQTLVDYGFRLPSALDNRPLTFEEFEQKMGYTIYTSATPGPYELQKADQVVEQIIRPTGIPDPEVEVRPTKGQVEDLLGEIRQRIQRGERVLVTTLTKRMAEKLSDYLMEQGIKVHYLHSEIDTLERVQILRDLRLGVYDVVVGINLLREGLDLPEVSLVAILDADKEGFLRSATALIQTIGRAARHVNGKVIMYADRVTEAMRAAIDETNRRRAKQLAYNREHGITPQSIVKPVHDLTERVAAQVAEESAPYRVETPEKMGVAELKALIAELERQMHQAAEALEFEKAAALRDQIFELKALLAEMPGLSLKERLRLLSEIPALEKK